MNKRKKRTDKLLLLCKRIIKIGPSYRPEMNGWVSKYEKRRKILALRLAAMDEAGKR